MPEITTEPRHQSGGLAVALAKLNLDALTVADAVADVATTAGENVTTAIRADLKEFKAEINARVDGVAGSIQSLQREIASLRWMIGVGFTLLSIFLAFSTFLRSSGSYARSDAPSRTRPRCGGRRACRRPDRWIREH